MKCGKCTLCCRLLYIHELNKPVGIQCNYCDNGCTIYGVHPKQCQGFECAYYQMENASEDFRPDNCHVIFEKLSDRIFLGVRDPHYKLTTVIRGQIQSFNSKGYSVILKSIDHSRPKLYLAQGHTQDEIDKEYNELLEKWRMQYMIQIFN
jgi:hypothetical protein